MIDHLLVTRLWDLYGWPESWVPLRGMDPMRLKRYPVISQYVSDDWRTLHHEKVTKAWDYGRIRFFYEVLLKGGSVDPITVDNQCSGMHIEAQPIVLDGHHRLAGAWFARVEKIPAHYSGRVDLLRYLKGQRKTVPL